MEDQTTILSLTRRDGIAGQFSIMAIVTEDRWELRRVEFVGSIYGGPVVMRTGPNEVFVTDSDRFGTFGEGWVHNFFAAS